MALKRVEPGLRFSPSEFRVTPDEIDRYEQYVISFPSISTTWFGTFAVAGTSAETPLVVINAIADYPRNLEFALAGSAAGMTGTAIINGKNQFGASITESLTFAEANNGGTVSGTSVFAHVDSGTLYYGTAVGSGTARIGVTTGTDTYFGLPARLGGTTDVKLLTRSTGAGAQTVNGGTIAGFVDLPRHAVRAPATLTGTQIISVLYRPTHVAEGSVEANLSQRV